MQKKSRPSRRPPRSRAGTLNLLPATTSRKSAPKADGTRWLERYAELRRQLSGFYEQDLIAFRVWFFQEFREAIWELQNLEERLAHYRQSTRSGPSIASFGDLPRWDFYRENFEAGLPEEKLAFGSSGRRTSRRPSEADQRRLKALYRRLARELHPDSGGRCARLYAELWHEAQRAYQGQDLKGLERLASFIESFVGKGGEDGSSPDQALLENLQGEIRRLQSFCKTLEPLPASNFLQRSRRRAELKREILKKVREQVRRLERELVQAKREAGDRQKQKSDQGTLSLF